MRVPRPAVAAAALVALVAVGAARGSPGPATAGPVAVVSIRPEATHAPAGALGAPPGTAFCEQHYQPTSNRESWAGETDLDVEYAHTIAPGASILLVETPTSENEGTTGFPQIVTAEKYVINHQLGGVISQSFSATEQTFGTKRSLLNLRGAYIDAASKGVALADQVAGHPLGVINPYLYRLAARHMPGVVDVVSGDNTVSFRQGGRPRTVPGFRARAGYDLASGVGTVNAFWFVPELAWAAGQAARR
jgi:subtilase family serine protease